MYHIIQPDFPDTVVFFRIAAGVIPFQSIVQRLLRKTVDIFQLRQHIPGKFAAVIFAKQLHCRYGRFDFMEPLFNVFLIFLPLPLYSVYFFQHGLFGHFHNLIIDLSLSQLRLLHNFRY